jgi:urease accessory protein
MGYSLARLLSELGVGTIELDEISYPAAFAFAAARWNIEPRAVLEAYLWAWLENQVMAAVKCVPLGQTAGQKILLALGGELHRIAKHASSVADEELGNFMPALAILSARHETQYSRLFRS